MLAICSLGPCPVRAICVIASNRSRRALATGRRAGGIQAPAILQLEIAVEAEEIRRAHRVVGARHVLRLVPQVREGKAQVPCHALHVVERVLRIVGGIVRADRHRADAVLLEVGAVADDAIDHRLDVGAVVADEHHQHAVRAADVGKAVALAVGGGQVEIDGLPAEFADGRGSHGEELVQEGDGTKPCTAALATSVGHMTRPTTDGRILPWMPTPPRERAPRFYCPRPAFARRRRGPAGPGRASRHARAAHGAGRSGCGCSTAMAANGPERIRSISQGRRLGARHGAHARARWRRSSESCSRRASAAGSAWISPCRRRSSWAWPRSSRSRPGAAWSSCARSAPAAGSITGSIWRLRRASSAGAIGCRCCIR